MGTKFEKERIRDIGQKGTHFCAECNASRFPTRQKDQNLLFYEAKPVD